VVVQAVDVLEQAARQPRRKSKHAASAAGCTTRLRDEVAKVTHALKRSQRVVRHVWLRSHCRSAISRVRKNLRRACTHRQAGI
jgi:hypothetical protein